MNDRSSAGFMVYVLPGILYSVLIYIISAQSNPPAPEFNFEWGDKLNHAGAFGLMMLMTFRAVRWLLPDRNIRVQIMLALLYCLLYGATDEIHQSYVPERHADLFDWIADVVGAILGALFILATQRSAIARLIFGPRLGEDRDAA